MINESHLNMSEDLIWWNTFVCSGGQVMKNQEAVDMVKSIKDPQVAAKRLTTEALERKSKDDISCIVIRFGWLLGRGAPPPPPLKPTPFLASFAACGILSWLVAWGRWKLKYYLGCVKIYMYVVIAFLVVPISDTW